MVSGSSVDGSAASTGRRDRPFSVSFWITQLYLNSGSASVTGGTGKSWFGGNTDPIVIAKQDAGEQTSGGGWNSNKTQWKVSLPNQGDNIRLSLYTDDSNYIDINPPGRGYDGGNDTWFRVVSKGYITPKWAHVLITYDPQDAAQTAITAKAACEFYFNGGGGSNSSDQVRLSGPELAAEETGTYSGMSGSMPQGGEPAYPAATGKPVPGSAAAKPLLIAPDLNQGYRTQIADLAVWNTALGPAEAKALYYAGISRVNFSIISNSGRAVTKLPDIMSRLADMNYPDDGNLDVRDVNASHGFYFSKKAGSIVYGDE
jgi:hypothetical protein